MNRKAQEAGNKKKIVGLDENGNPIYKDTGKLRKAVFRTAADMTASSATSRHGLTKITSDTKNEINKANTDATNKLTTAEHAKTKTKLTAALNDVSNSARQKLVNMQKERTKGYLLFNDS